MNSKADTNIYLLIIVLLAILVLLSAAQADFSCTDSFWCYILFQPPKSY